MKTKCGLRVAGCVWGLFAAVCASGQPTPVVKASQAEVNAGVNASKFVTPATLAGYVGGNTNSPGGAIVSGVLYTNLMTAVSNAVAPTTIRVLAGTYLANQLGRNGVNWELMNGVIISNYASDNISNSWLPIFSDFNGATNYNVIGPGASVVWHNGTNFNEWVGTTNVAAFHPNVCGSTNAALNGFCAITTTNPLSTLKFQLKSVEGYSHRVGFAFAVYNKNGSTFRLDADDVLDKSYGTTMTWVRPNGQTNQFPGRASETMWLQGDCTYNVKHFGPTTDYCVWGVYPTNGIATNSLWVNADFVEGRIYTSPNLGDSWTNAHTHANTWRCWFNVKQLENMTGSVGGYNLFAGYNYIIGGAKVRTIDTLIGAIGVQGDVSVVGGGGVNDTTLWVDCEKVTSANYGLQNLDGRVYGRISHFNDGTPGQLKSGIYVGSLALPLGGVAITELSGQVIEGTNAPLVTQAGGTNRLNGYKISTRGSLNIPVQVSTNGLALQNCLLIANAGTNCITATATNSVALYGVAATGTTNANVTIVPNGGFTVDANVQ